jgi:hypothetical protein
MSPGRARRLMGMETTWTWKPSSSEVAAIVAEMRPVIDAFADRDARRLAAWSAEDRTLAVAA